MGGWGKGRCGECSRVGCLPPTGNRPDLQGQTDLRWDGYTTAKVGREVVRYSGS